MMEPDAQQQAEYEAQVLVAGALAVHVKLPSGLVLTLAAWQHERVRDLSARALAAAAGHGVTDLPLQGAAPRLIFAGRALEPDALLGSYNVDHESELLLLLRAAPPADSLDPLAGMRSALARAQLKDFEGFEKVGGRDITAVAGLGYTQNGVCSYVYKAWLSADGTRTPLAIKVMHNLDAAMHQTIAIARTFSAEHELLSDVQRLPAHPHIMAVLRAFTDDASSLPDWDFGDSDVVQPRTMMLVMPFVPKDLLGLLKATRREGGEAFGVARAARLGGHVARALVHLETHGIVHRDVKMDNILVAAVGTRAERGVLTDFGMCLDLKKFRIEGSRVPIPCKSTSPLTADTLHDLFPLIFELSR